MSLPTDLLPEIYQICFYRNFLVITLLANLRRTDDELNIVLGASNALHVQNVSVYDQEMPQSHYTVVLSYEYALFVLLFLCLECLVRGNSTESD